MESERQEIVGDAAIDVLAQLGVRGLTHRAVDRAAGLPMGSTSNVARTRPALLMLALRRLVELEMQAFGLMADAARAFTSISATAQMFSAITHVQLTDRQSWTLARYALALEAIHDDSLNAVYQEASRGLAAVAEMAVTDLGSTETQRHSELLLAFIQGLLFATIVNRRPTSTLDDLARGFEGLLRGMLHDN